MREEVRAHAKKFMVGWILDEIKQNNFFDKLENDLFNAFNKLEMNEPTMNFKITEEIVNIYLEVLRDIGRIRYIK